MYIEFFGGGIVRDEFLKGGYDWLGYYGGEKEFVVVRFGIKFGKV